MGFLFTLIGHWITHPNKSTYIFPEYVYKDAKTPRIYPSKLLLELWRARLKEKHIRLNSKKAKKEMEWKKSDLDVILVPLAFLINIAYHFWLWHKVRTEPLTTIIGTNAKGRRYWVSAIMKVQLYIIFFFFVFFFLVLFLTCWSNNERKACTLCVII